jgi:hypothetical protein
LEDGIYTAMSKRSQHGRMEKSKAMDYGSGKASPDVLKPRNIYKINVIHLVLCCGHVYSVLL